MSRRMEVERVVREDMELYGSAAYPVGYDPLREQNKFYGRVLPDVAEEVGGILLREEVEQTMRSKKFNYNTLIALDDMKARYPGILSYVGGRARDAESEQDNNTLGRKVARFFGLEFLLAEVK